MPWWDEEEDPAPAKPVAAAKPDWVQAAIAAITGEQGGDVSGGGGEIGNVQPFSPGNTNVDDPRGYGGGYQDAPRDWGNTNAGMPPSGQPGYQDDPFAATPWGELPPMDREAVTQGMVPYGQVHPDYRDNYQRNSPDSMVQANDTGYRWGDTNLPQAGGLGEPRSNPAWDDYTMNPGGMSMRPGEMPQQGDDGGDLSWFDRLMGVGRAEAAGPEGPKSRADAFATIQAPRQTYPTRTPYPTNTPRPQVNYEATAEAQATARSAAYEKANPTRTPTAVPTAMASPGAAKGGRTAWDAALAAATGGTAAPTATAGPAAPVTAAPVAQPPNPNDSALAEDYRGDDPGMRRAILSGVGAPTQAQVEANDRLPQDTAAQLASGKEWYSAAAPKGPATPQEADAADRKKASDYLNANPPGSAPRTGGGGGGSTFTPRTPAAGSDKGVPLAVLLAAAGAQGGQGGLGAVGNDMMSAINQSIGKSNDMPGSAGATPYAQTPKAATTIQIPKEFLDNWDNLSPRVQEQILTDVMTRRRQMEQTASIESSQAARDAQFNANRTGTGRTGTGAAAAAPFVPRTGGGGGGRTNATPAALPVAAAGVVAPVAAAPTGALPAVTRYTPHIVELNQRNGTNIPVDVMLSVIHAQSKGDRNYAGPRGSGLAGAPNSSFGAGEDRGDPNTALGHAMTTIADLAKQNGGDFDAAYRAYLRLLGLDDSDAAMAEWRKTRMLYSDYFKTE